MADGEVLFVIGFASKLRNYKKLIKRCKSWDGRYIRQLVLARHGRSWKVPSDNLLNTSLFALIDKTDVELLRSVIRNITVLDLSNSKELLVPSYEGDISDDSDDDTLFESQLKDTTDYVSSSMSDVDLSEYESDEEFLCSDSSGVGESIYELILRNVKWSDLRLDHLKELYLDNISQRNVWTVFLLEDLLTAACKLEVLSIKNSNWTTTTVSRGISLKLPYLKYLNLSLCDVQKYAVLTEDFYKLFIKAYRPFGRKGELALDLRQLRSRGLDISKVVETFSESLKQRHSKIAITILTEEYIPKDIGIAKPPIRGLLSSDNDNIEIVIEDKKLKYPSPQLQSTFEDNRLNTTTVSKPLKTSTSAPLSAFEGLYRKNASLSALGTHSPRVSFNNLHDSASLVCGVGDLVMILLEQRHLSLGNILNRKELSTLVRLTQGQFPDYITPDQENSIQMLSLSCLEELTIRSLSMKLALLDRLDEDDDIILGDATHQITFIAPSQLRYCCSATEAESSYSSMEDPTIKPVVIIDARGDAHLRQILSSSRVLFGSVASTLSLPSPDICDQNEASLDSYAQMLRDIKSFVEKKVRSKRRKPKNTNRSRVYLGQPMTEDVMHEALLIKLICDLLGLKCSYRRIRDHQNHQESEVIFHQVFVRVPRHAGRDNLISISWGDGVVHSDIDNHHRFSAIYDLSDLLISSGHIDKENKIVTKKVSMNLNKLTPHHLQAVNLDTHFKFHEKKGEGTFGTVYAVSSKNRNGNILPEPARKKRRISQIGHLISSTNMDEDIEMFALKLIPLENVDDLRDAQEEIEILKMFNHPRLIPCFNIFYGYREDNESVLILCCLMELCDCSLEEFIKDKVSDSSEDCGGDSSTDRSLDDNTWKLLLLLDACRGMCHLHDPKHGMSEQIILHRDLKPGNILLSFKKRELSKKGLTRAMIADFGVATFRPLRNIKQANEAFSPMTQEPGTYAYMAPEQAKSSAYDRPADVYGFGMIVLRLIGVGELPKQKKLKELKIKEVFEKLQNLELNEDQYIQTLAARCLEESPHDRPTFHDIARSLVLEIMERTTRTNYNKLLI